MASSVGGQDESNLALRWSYLVCSRLPAACRKKSFSESHVMNPLLTKLVRSRWLDNVLVLFLRVYAKHKHAKKKLIYMQLM